MRVLCYTMYAWISARLAMIHAPIPTHALGAAHIFRQHMKYFSWRNLFVVLVLLGLTWYVFNHQNETRAGIETLKAQIF